MLEFRDQLVKNDTNTRVLWGSVDMGSRCERLDVWEGWERHMEMGTLCFDFVIYVKESEVQYNRIVVESIFNDDCDM